MKTIIQCWQCYKSLRIPISGKGNIRCPHCNASLRVENGKVFKLLSNKQQNLFGISKSQLTVLAVSALLFIIILFYQKHKEAFNMQSRSVGHIFNKNPQLQFEDDKVNVYGIYYTVGFVGVNQVSTNLSELDEISWDKLRGRKGTCPVFSHRIEKDKYGNENEEIFKLGEINFDELNKYRSYEDYVKAGGLQEIISISK